ncbi:hypothetical protein ANO11243_017870 [Dothideomycetidae sp. 11243]|nr:hypothetical protein ANO11243_017870 [fungal sp. No.11243]
MLFLQHAGVLSAYLILVAQASFIARTADGEFDLSDRYIVSLKPGIDMDKHLSFVQDLHNSSMGTVEGKTFGGVSHEFNIGDFKAYAGHFDPAVVEKLKNHEDTEDEGPPPPTHETLVKQKQAPWNLHRISHRGMMDQGNYWFARAAGRGTFIYFLDSGINPDHSEFQGRTQPAPEPAKPIDTNGHGTFIAGILGGRTYGVSKKSILVPVKILDHRRSTTKTALLQGYTWSVNHILTNNRVGKSVINISSSGKQSAAINDAVDAAYAKGVVTVVPAGNQNSNAALMSPASARRAITVGATDRNKARTRFSNWGPRVNIFAPGYKICSAWIGGSNRALRGASGTAEAAAHVAGMIAYFQSFNHLRTAETAVQFLDVVSTRGVVRNEKQASNLFAYNFSGK